MNSSQLASYDYFKRILLSIKGTQDGPALQFGASFLAGTVATSKCMFRQYQLELGLIHSLQPCVPLRMLSSPESWHPRAAQR
jgi:hypothetical protein